MGQDESLKNRREDFTSKVLRKDFRSKVLKNCKEVRPSTIKTEIKKQNKEKRLIEIRSNEAVCISTRVPNTTDPIFCLSILCPFCISCRRPVSPS
jgi:hypothetical protein